MVLVGELWVILDLFPESKLKGDSNDKSVIRSKSKKLFGNLKKAFGKVFFFT